MVAEWIKVRRGLRQHPKTVIVASKLEETGYFKKLLPAPAKSDKGSLQHHKAVTSEFVTRVTVSALVDIWVSLNDVIDKGCRVKNMKLDHIDTIVGLPGFGKAMEAVEWVKEDSKGLFFESFGDWNVPASQRSAPQSDAERKRKSREKKEQQSRHERHETSHREEKSREEKRRGDLHLHLQHWGDFLSAWKNGKGKPYALENPPPNWSSTIRDAAWLEQAKKALAHLPNCKYLKTPMSMKQFLMRDKIEKILGGELNDPRQQKNNSDAQLPPRQFTGEDREAFERTRKHLESKRQ